MEYETRQITLEEASDLMKNTNITVCENSVGALGQDTGHVFISKKTGQPIRVVADLGLDVDDVIKQVEERHMS
jgi:tartrate dehydratase alpha subunit/fumarate hydratase class I-like protein